MKSLFIFGLSGRMGQQVKALAEESNDFKVVGGYSKENNNLDINDSVDVVVDFSLPETQNDLFDFCKNKKCALVSGTTGLKVEQENKLKELGREVPVFWAANMSFGIYLMSQLVEQLSGQKTSYEFQMTETHHKHKKDAPSGTALFLEKAVHSSARLKPTQSIREGEVLGIHNFSAHSAYESIEIIHTAKDRKLFADGALSVALWLTGQAPGFYSMADYFKKS